MEKEIPSEKAMNDFGAQVAKLLRGGEVIELVGDVGAGKTALTKAIALNLGITEDVQSPTFTISRLYETPSGLRLAHYDFYRLTDAGIMADEIFETINDPHAITIIEWGELVYNVLPADRLTITITSPGESSRHLSLKAGGIVSKGLIEQLL
jgi:tRNA threonylcarbamoyladenosine biosynthesis protein TsaE